MAELSEAPVTSSIRLAATAGAEVADYVEILKPRVMALVVHPYLMGVPHRVKHLRRVLEVIRQKRDVLFWTGAQIADWYLAAGPAAP